MQGFRYYSNYILTVFILGIADGKLPLNFHVVEEGLLYRSAQPTLKSMETVFANYGIRTVINLRGENPNELWWQLEKKTCDKHAVKMVNIAMSALDLPSREVLLKLYDSLLEEEHPLWIHCKAGANRTGVACAMWRMIVQGESKEKAREELSPRFFHFTKFNPKMDELLTLFEPSREWVLTVYNK